MSNLMLDSLLADDEDDEFFANFDLDGIVSQAEGGCEKSRTEDRSAADVASPKIGTPVLNQTKSRRSSDVSGTENSSRVRRDKGFDHSSSMLGSGRRPLSIRQKAEAKATETSDHCFSEGLWRAVMKKYPQIEALAEKFNAQGVLKENRAKSRKGFPLSTYPMLCVRIKFLEHNGTQGVFHDPTGDFDCNIDPDLILANDLKLQTGCVLILKNPEVVASSWLRATVNVKARDLYVLGFEAGLPSSAGGPQIEHLMPSVSESQFVKEVEESWRQYLRKWGPSTSCSTPKTSSCGFDRPSSTPQLPSSAPVYRPTVPAPNVSVSDSRLQQPRPLVQPQSCDVPASTASPCQRPDRPAGRFVFKRITSDASVNGLKRPSTDALEKQEETHDSPNAAKSRRVEIPENPEPATVAQPAIEFPENDGFEDLVMDLDF